MYGFIDWSVRFPSAGSLRWHALLTLLTPLFDLSAAGNAATLPHARYSRRYVKCTNDGGRFSFLLSEILH